MSARRPFPPPVRLGYRFCDGEQRGAELDHALFPMLAAVRDGGSIAHAARTLGCSYRHVWGELRSWEAALGEPLILWSQGQRARLTEFGERLLWAELRARKRMQPHIEALREQLGRIVDDARDQREQHVVACASHDLALPRLSEYVGSSAGLDLELRFQGSVDSLRSLNARRCIVAGFHVPAMHGASRVFTSAFKPLLKPGLHKLIACSRRRQGLMVRKEHAGRVVAFADLVGSGLRFVNRQLGSGTRLLMDHFVEHDRIDVASLPDYESVIEESHVAVAACVASGVADVGPGIEAAAIEFGLHFVPLVEEEYFLVCLKPNLNHPAVLRLREVLASEGWVRVLASLPGYASPAAPGSVLRMTAALPWWTYRTPRRLAPSGTTAVRSS
ncbi:MAG TPA: substrate-binding domain-containing protein [Caldimonas sp.]|nr:substrate-binding domain-containing protein [Caldimonas sp.]